MQCVLFHTFQVHWTQAWTNYDTCNICDVIHYWHFLRFETHQEIQSNQNIYFLCDWVHVNSSIFMGCHTDVSIFDCTYHYWDNFSGISLQRRVCLDDLTYPTRPIGSQLRAKLLYSIAPYKTSTVNLKISRAHPSNLHGLHLHNDHMGRDGDSSQNRWQYQ